jgi:uncharacterized protein YbjQ (UPF0145 family)
VHIYFLKGCCLVALGPGVRSAIAAAGWLISAPPLTGPAATDVLPIMTESTGTSVAAFPVTTAFELPNAVIERDLGVAFGLVVRSMGAVKSISAGFKALRQGEVSEYTQLLEDSRRHAVDRMVENARLLGANGVVAMRFDSSEMGQQLTEIVAYGTAVVVRSASPTA